MPPRLRLAGAPVPADPTRPANEPISVVIADDHAGVRRSLRLLLDGEDGLEVVAEAGDLDATSRALARHRPRVLVLDLWSTDGNARSTVRDLRKRAPGTQIVAVTMNDSPPFARALLEAGAAAFVLKDLADSDLPRAIRAAAGGEEYVSPRIDERLKMDRERDHPAGDERRGPAQGRSDHPAGDERRGPAQGRSGNPGRGELDA